MCLAVPAQLISINEAIGTVELTGATRDCSLLLVPDAKVGDWLLVHAGFAVQIVDEEDIDKASDAIEEILSNIKSGHIEIGVKDLEIMKKVIML